MRYVVETHVPPPSANPKGRAVKYPLADMQVGDSFRFAHDARLRSSIANNARAQFKGTRRFTTKTVVEDGQYYFRIWRIA